MEELQNEIRAADVRCKNAVMEAARFGDALRSEQEHNAQLEQIRKSLEINIKETTMRCQEAEAGGLKGGRRVLAKLEQKVCNLNL